LRFTTSTAEAVARAAVVFIAVGTPPRDDGSADVDQVLEAARQIGRALDGYTVVVTKSTVPVGTTERVRAAIRAETDRPFAVASNPEFLKEGDAVADFLKPARVVIGADDPCAAEVLRTLYRDMLRTSDRVMVMDIRSAELTKYAANAMLATRISFMNELAGLAEAVGADIEEIRRGIGSDPRIGPKFLFAGAGFGGSCFPKDLHALLHTGRALGVPLAILGAVDQVNERQKHALARRVLAHFGTGTLEGRRIAVWGLAFKPQTDDIRESPALAVIAELRAAGARIAGYDPVAGPNMREALGDAIDLAEDPYAAAAGADAVILVTEWHELRQPDFGRLRRAMRTPVLFDGRNVWSADQARRAGFVYHAIGRPVVRSSTTST
ncbi:MAG TPA: UDP-glucose/GDP-mannose dehydrogenase family protein, partial [Kofleriaceae bacterium]